MTSALALTFHGLETHQQGSLLPHDEDAKKYTISAASFKSAVRMISANSCCTAEGFTKKDNGNWAIITFDDGLVSDYEIALPVLQAYNLKATFFITADNIGKPRYMSIHQIRKMAENGMEIGSHGLTHSYLVNMNKKQVQDEISNSKDRIEQLLGKPVSSFAPVGGHFYFWMVKIAQTAGYSCFASMIPGVTLQTDSFLILRRNHIQAQHNAGYVSRLIARDGGLLATNYFRYKILFFIKRSLGMRNYDRLKSCFLRSLKQV